MDRENRHPLALFNHCPICGKAGFSENNQKSKRCSACGFVYYFNPSAATAAFIVNNQNELLVCRRGKEPALGSWDLPGGFIDMYETGEEGIAREVKEETGLEVKESRYLFSLPNTYLYSGFLVHTLDLFFLCKVGEDDTPSAHDDVAESRWIPIDELNPESFGLDSIRKGVALFLTSRHWEKQTRKTIHHH